MARKRKARARRGLYPTGWRRRLLDLGFLELDVLAHLRVVLAQRELLCRLSRVLFGRVEEAGAGGAHELDQNRAGLRHGRASSKSVGDWPRNIGAAIVLSRIAQARALR